MHQILIQDLILVYWVAFNFFNGYPLTPPQLCFIRGFLVKLKDSNVYMFFLSNIYTPFVLINIYIYIYIFIKMILFFFFWCVENILVLLCLDVTLKMRKKNFLVWSTTVMVCWICDVWKKISVILSLFLVDHQSFSCNFCFRCTKHQNIPRIFPRKHFLPKKA